MTFYPHLSKSRYISGLQYHLRLWNDTFARHLATEPTEVLQAIFDRGTQIGELATKRYPKGRLITQDHRQVPEALEETKRVVQDDSVPSVFEAALACDDAYEREKTFHDLRDYCARDTLAMAKVKQALEELAR